MKKIIILSICFISGCSSLNYTEKMAIDHLKAEGITVQTPVGGYEEPANPMAAGGLNLLPGVGNFYLASGNGADKDHYLYGFGNLVSWPISIFWGVAEGVIDANTINQKEFVRYYMYHPAGKSALMKRGLQLNQDGSLRRIGYGGYGYQQAPVYQPYYY